MEYETLRQEILNSIVACDNYKIAMYTITAAILCAAFEFKNAILFLIPYVILFAFQWAIESKNENMIVLSAYISVFLEKGNGWESNSSNIKKTIYANSTFEKPKGFASRIIGRISSAQLGLLCSISSIVYSLMELAMQESLIVLARDLSCILLSVVLYIRIRVRTNKICTLNTRRKAYIEYLESYKQELEPRPKCCMACNVSTHSAKDRCPRKDRPKEEIR